MKKDGMKGEAEEVITDGLSLQIEHRLRGICGMNTSKGEERMKMKIKKETPTSHQCNYWSFHLNR